MTNIKSLRPNEIKIDEKSCKNIIVYYNGYITVKKFTFAKINRVNHICLIINKKIATNI